MPKRHRQNRLLALVRERAVATQHELREILRAEGIEVDSGTLSRDLRELGLVRVQTAAGFRYSPLDEATPVVPGAAERLAGRLLRSAEKSHHLIVVKTDPANAQAVGLALDRLGWPEVAGTVAGDDTLLVIVREGADPGLVLDKILALKE